MYKLTFSPVSPYVRKVRLASYLCGINNHINLVNAESKMYKKIKSKNPLAKIPVLIKEDGNYLFDSRVIIDFFNRQKGLLIPEKIRDTVLTRCALSEGIIDAALLFVYSIRYAGGKEPSEVWQNLQINKIKNSLTFIDKDISNWNSPTKINASHIGLIVALDYLDFRNVFQWKNNMKNLVDWHKIIKEELPGYFETFPKD